MNAYDSFGDGWNGSTYSISSTCGSDSLAFSYVVANNGGLLQQMIQLKLQVTII